MGKGSLAWCHAPGQTLTRSPWGCICRSGMPRGALPLTPTPLH